jgi:hypothetical protein
VYFRLDLDKNFMFMLIISNAISQFRFTMIHAFVLPLCLSISRRNFEFVMVQKLE